ncbi:hypothetical protein CUS07_02740 [Enterococcus faecalis]|uniref:hypothetical protein n=1 Tax=Enterococcus TaxID=1350 RepID=UPI000CF21CF5|nr:hypothetical protein [Enterococcus faecalis]PZT49187.1 hypothetical protein CYK80_16845 [Clostridium perfringens]PQE36857.1 hypothetical protein CUS33_04600 [Enterococcus faecalis]PQE60947.1 hypothetical protein CUS07_02740 [Enterococcus faecalis]PQE67074.1 hypothetical protein CUS03_06285 [Enterococcus faecalis]PQE99026.1 hypothetical protein CUS90_06395 [Enterococcus faecalis]
MWVKLMNLKDHVTEIAITFIIAFVYTWIDSGKIEILKTLLITIIFLAMFYAMLKITNRKRK